MLIFYHCKFLSTVGTRIQAFTIGLKKKSESYRFRSHLFTDLLTKELANLASDYLMLC